MSVFALAITGAAPVPVDNGGCPDNPFPAMPAPDTSSFSIDLADTAATEALGDHVRWMRPINADEVMARVRHQIERLVASGASAILATGGSLVTDHGSFDLLRRSAVTIWLKAKPADHWARVVAQGDARPMANRSGAMNELYTRCLDTFPEWLRSLATDAGDLAKLLDGDTLNRDAKLHVADYLFGSSCNTTFALVTLEPEITLPEDLRVKALRPIERMLELSV